jgi:predicted pyridoxine 5'-phosphate oxidase superfamily flavin-nucleotide-binding protein
MRERIERSGRRMIRQFMPDQHREFFAELPFVIVGSLDAHRRPWASMLAGPPGFLRSPDPQTLAIEAVPGDLLGVNLVVGAPVGLLGIQLETRRRNRMNGTVDALGDSGFTVRVGQSFGNCPQHIHPRAPVTLVAPIAAGAPRLEGPLLSAAATALIRGADTFFIASASPAAEGGDPAEGVDVSHRGGQPGFVQVAGEEGRTVLTWPDFMGNFLFNTLGNLVVNPRAGVLFVDFTSGGLLSLTGETEVVWDGPEVEAIKGAERLLRLRVTGGMWIEHAVPLRWAPAGM